MRPEVSLARFSATWWCVPRGRLMFGRCAANCCIMQPLFVLSSLRWQAVYSPAQRWHGGDTEAAQRWHRGGIELQHSGGKEVTQWWRWGGTEVTQRWYWGDTEVGLRLYLEGIMLAQRWHRGDTERKLFTALNAGTRHVEKPSFRMKY